MVELPHPADLEVVRSLGRQQDAKLVRVEFSQSALDLVSCSVLADVLGLDSSYLTEALTFSRKALSFTYSK